MKRKKLQEAREKGLISPSSDWTLDSDGEPARRSDLVKYVYEYGVVTLSFFFFYKLDNVQLVFFFDHYDIIFEIFYVMLSKI